MFSSKTLAWIGAIVIVGAILYYLNPAVVIESGEVGIKVRLGKYSNQELTPGLHFRIPFMEEIRRVDVKVHSIEYKMGVKDSGMNSYYRAYGLEDKSGIIRKPVIQVLDERGLPIQVELTVQYKILPDMASEILQQWGWNWEEKIVNPVVRAVVRDVIGQYPAEKMPTARNEIAVKIEKKIFSEIERVSEKGVVVVAVQLRNIILPTEIERKIKEVQLAKQEAEKMKYVEEKAKKEQEVALIRAETVKKEKIIKAEANKQEAILKAQGVAEANRLIAESLRQNPEILKWKALEVQQSLAESLRMNPNATVFVNLPGGNKLNLWMGGNVIK